MTNNKIYFIANWKMNAYSSLINRLNKVINLSKKKKLKKVGIIYCPPFTLLEQFVKISKRGNIDVGAQDCFYESGFGPYTGNVSTKMIKLTGASYIILRHSEKRTIGDNNNIINKKIKSSINEKLKIIFCIGESYKEKKQKKTYQVIKNQIIHGLKNIKKYNDIIIAYEPVWSIGTGLIPKNYEIFQKIDFIKTILRKKFKFNTPKVIYGGSVNSKNINNLKKIKNVDGFLIGGASLNQNKFIDIVKKTII